MRILTRRLWLALAAVGVTGTLVIWALRPTDVEVNLAVVQRGTLSVTVGEEGETRVRDRFVVSAPVSGRVLRIDLEPGDPVVANETVLATFVPSDPTPLDVRSRAEAIARADSASDALGSARADRDRVRADLDFARRELARKRELLKAGATALDQVDAAERSVKTLEQSLRAAEAAVRTGEHQVELARAALVQIRPAPRSATWPLRSPITGTVLRRVLESERVVNAGEPLVEVGDVTRLEVVTDLLSREAARVRPGNAVIVEGWGGAPLHGRVSRVEPSGFTKVSALGIEEQRVNVIVDLDQLPSGTPLGDGYRVDVQIVVAERESVLMLPIGAIFRDNQDWAVFAARDGRAVKTDIQVGQRSGTHVEIVGGLAEGDRAILYPSDSISDGTRIVARGAPAAR